MAIDIINEDTATCALEYVIPKWSESAGNDGTIKFNVSGASPVTAAKDQMEGW